MIIGVTGLAGSGKTTAAKYFKEIDKNITIIDADKIGHKLLNKKIVKDKLIKDFSKKILTKNRISRKKLSKIVFENKKNLTKLNNIIHPMLIKEIKKNINEINKGKNNIKNKITVIDAALLNELKLRDICDKIILIKTNKKVIMQRNKKLKNVLVFQKPIKKANFIITNNSTKTELKGKIRGIYNTLK